MKNLLELAKQASSLTSNKTASIVLKVASCELTAALYLIKYKELLIADGSLTEQDYTMEGGNAWDDACFAMQQSNDYEDSFKIQRKLI